MSKLDIEKKLLDFSVGTIREVINGSNKVFLCEMCGDENDKFLSIYKPIKGERPLRDFFVGNLASRELASYEISKYFQWPSLPPVVIKEGPFGEGSFQKFIDHDPKNNYFNLINDFYDELSMIIIFDFIILNTDRKAGSIILDNKNKIWAIDQALTFNPYTRFRTVMFEFNKMKIKEKILFQIKKFIKDLETQNNLYLKLSSLITEQEIISLIERSKLLLENEKIPTLDPYSNVPYPLI